MDTAPPSPSGPDLQWSNVGFGFAFIAMNMVLSQVLNLQIGTSIVISALRCIVQLTLVATILERVFAAQNLWTVAAIALLLNMLGAFETVVIKAQRRCHNMFPIVFVAMLVSTVPMSILGAHFAMGVRPFWSPAQYIPVIGMLCGNAIAGVSVTLGYVLKELEYVPSLLRTAKADTVAARTETRRRHTSRLARRASRPAVLSP
jgi:ABC-type iron transport system FetAB permease component